MNLAQIKKKKKKKFYIGAGVFLKKFIITVDDVLDG